VTLASTVPARSGDGTPEFVLALARKLSARFDIVIIAPRVSGAPREENVGGVAIRRFAYFPARWEKLAEGAILPNLRAKPWTIVQVPSLLVSFIGLTLHEIKRLRPSLIHAHWIIPAGLVAWIVRRLRGTPYIVTAHGADGFALQGPAWRRLKRLVLDSATAVLPTSTEMAERLDLSGRERDATVVPMGVDVDEIQREATTTPPRSGTFVFVGRLEDKKGVDTLLRAAATVPEVRLVIIGDGNAGPSLRRLAADLGLSDRVSFRGQRSKDEVLAEMRRSQAVVVPSRVGRGGDRETTPLVMSEAMSAGVPVMASRMGGLSEHISHRQTGILFDPSSEESLAAALRFAHENPDELARYARRAMELVKGSPLDLAYTASRYAEAYERAIAHAPDVSTRD
jgi:glycosyltransferase involved in cell wall biosynthesis